MKDTDFVPASDMARTMKPYAKYLRSIGFKQAWSRTRKGDKRGGNRKAAGWEQLYECSTRPHHTIHFSDQGHTIWNENSNPIASFKNLVELEGLVQEVIGEPVTVPSIIIFIQKLIHERRVWAGSDDGVKTLGPGSPEIPGVADMTRILKFAQTGKDDLR